MGQDLFGTVSEFTALEPEIDQVLGYSVRQLCLSKADPHLNQTQYTQPALYVVNALAYLARKSESPAYVAGHSLGEYNALLAAGVFDFMTGLRLVQRRGAMMAQAKNGGMAAVIGLAPAEIEAALRESGLSTLDVANFNTPSQIVVSGPVADIARAEAIIKQAGARHYMPLRVSAAFHSRYMVEASHTFSDFLAGFTFNAPQIPVISNVTGRPYPTDEQADAAVKTLLSQQICQSVQWTASIRYLMGQGVTEFVEVGPGKVLTRLVSKVQQEADPLPPEPTPPVYATPPLSDTPTPAAYPNGDRHPIAPNNLGSPSFKARYGLKYAYLAGAMYGGISSREMVTALGQAGLMGYLSTSGRPLTDIEADIQQLQQTFTTTQPYGLNLLATPNLEPRLVDLLLQYNIQHVEAAGYMQLTPDLIRYRLSGVYKHPDGRLHSPHHIVAKVTRPEVAEMFMQPAPEHIVQKLVAAGQLTQAEADLAPYLPVAADICAVADSGWHTDHGVAATLLPALYKLRNTLMTRYDFSTPIHIGAAGGLGTPEAAAAAFVLGTDFILTGSINQCTIEARTSDTVKDILQAINVQDTTYAPAATMFELGAKVQVLKKGVFFPARANKLYTLYQHYDSLDGIDLNTRQQLQDKYFGRSFEQIWSELCTTLSPTDIAQAEQHPKHKMALIFKWYLIDTAHLAIAGTADRRVDYQVFCGSALGAFNQWAQGTKWEPWTQRRVAEIGIVLMQETAALLERRFVSMHNG